jgi:hypothetical protein
MRPVDQTTYGFNDGNCFSACVASILEKSIVEVPRFHGVSPSFLQWLARFGLSATLYKRANYVPRGYAVAAGTSLRFAGRMHACVAYDGAVVHDPHPSRDGLPFGVEDYAVLHGPHGEAMWFSGI